MTTLSKLFMWIDTTIRARHLFGLGFIALAIATIIRPFGTVLIIANAYGLQPIPYAIIFAMCGTLLIIWRSPWYIRYLLTIPFVLYLDGTITFITNSPTTPYNPLVIYVTCYIVVLYFMFRERDE